MNNLRAAEQNGAAADPAATGGTGHAGGAGTRSRGRNLFRVLPWLYTFVRMRSFQFLLVFPAFVIFYFFILAGLAGSPVGNRNIIIVFVWILWWFLLIALMVPFFGRLWCVMCPIPFFGEWFQRMALIKVRGGRTGGTRNTMSGLNKRWPRSLSNIWIQNIGFLLLGMFFIILATRPFVSAAVLGGMLILSTGLAMVYQRRVFCSYLCPVSGFLGMYSTASAIELRPVDPDVCINCREKSCTSGSDQGWACPWFLYMGELDRNNFCGLCMECVKSCANENIGLFTRPFFSDVQMKGYDEVWKSFIMLTLALVYNVVLFGPWGNVKDWANVSQVGDWRGFLLYALSIAAICLAVVPAVWGLVTYLSKKLGRAADIGWKTLFVRYSYVLVPLGLFAWIALSVPLVMVNGSYVLAIISDPLGRGWNLFGTSGVPWTPIYPEYAVYVQILLMLAGLGFSLKKGLDIGRPMFADKRRLAWSLLPVGLFCLLVTAVFLLDFAA